MHGYLCDQGESYSSIRTELGNLCDLYRECCVICSESDGRLMQCKDAESWARFYRVGLIKQHRQILDLSTGEQDFPQSPV